MDARIESMAREGGEFLGDYVVNVVTAAGKFTERLLADVTTLASGVIEEATKVVLAATDAFVPDQSRKA
jgi:hypothetical protein